MENKYLWVPAGILIIVILLGGLIFVGIRMNNFKIVDETEVCAQALEEIHRDMMYIYYFPCIKSNNVFIEFSDGRKIKVVDALAQKLVTIKQLEIKGLKIIKEPIQ